MTVRRPARTRAAAGLLAGALAAGGSNASYLGTKYAIDIINERGGVEGVKIKPIYVDAQSKPEVAINETERLINQEKVDVIMGVFSSAHCVPMAQKADAAKKFMWANVCVASAVFKDKKLQYVFRPQVHSDQFGEASCAFLKEQTKAKLGKDPKTVTAAVQGFGNVGSFAAVLLEQQGVKVVAISDVSGAYYNANGIDAAAAFAYSRANKNSLEGFTGGSKITNEQLLELDVFLLAPCALQDVITEANAGNIKAKLIVEGANGPCSASADKILDSKNITIVPDILANAGGVTISYFEWVQNRLGHYWTEEEVNAKGDPKMKEAFEEVWQASQEYKCSMRIAAYIVGIRRVGKGIALKGNF